MIVKYMDEQHLNQKSYQALHLLPCMPWDSRFTQCDEPSWLIRQNLNLGDRSCASYQKAIPPTSPAGGCCGVSGADDYSSECPRLCHGEQCKATVTLPRKLAFQTTP